MFFLVLNYFLFFSNYSFCQWQQTNLPTTNEITCLDTSGINLFAGNSEGLFLTTNNGESWAVTGLTDIAVSSLAINGINIFAVTNMGISLSTNNGANWTSVYTNPTYTNLDISAIATNNNNIVAGTNGTAGDVYLSTNNGNTWKTILNTYNSYKQTWVSINCIAISDSNIFAGTAGFGIFNTTDNGNVWNPNTYSNTIIPSPYISALAISDTNIFAEAENMGQGGGLFLSTNNGFSWTSINKGLTDSTGDTYSTSVTSFAFNGKNIFVGTLGGGVFLSTNNGGNWNTVNNGLTDLEIYSLAISKTYLYAGTSATGVWKRAISDITGVNGLEVNNYELKVKFYPNPTANYIIIENKNNNTNKYILTLRNIEGQEIFNEKIEFTNDYKLDLTNLINGLYLLSLQNDKENYINKIVIQK